MTSAQTSHVMPLLTHPGVTALPGLPIKGSLFHSVGSQTLFTRSPQENFPVGSRRIYGLINLFFKKAHVLQLVGSGEAEPSSPGRPLLGAGEGYVRTLYLGQEEIKRGCWLPCLGGRVKPCKGAQGGPGGWHEGTATTGSLPPIPHTEGPGVHPTLGPAVHTCGL